MKRLLLIYLFSALALLSCNNPIPKSVQATKHHNKIDEISNFKDLVKLLASIDLRYINFKISPTLHFQNNGFVKGSDSLQTKAIAKADFDNNGYTDLLLVGNLGDKRMICILDSGQNHFYIKPFAHNIFQDDAIAKIVFDSTATYIDYYSLIEDKIESERLSHTNKGLMSFSKTEDLLKYQDSIYQANKTRAKKLTFKFGSFIEYNSLVRDYKIQKIEYKTTPCFGRCPIFELTINSDRTAEYKALQFNKLEGNFKSVIDKEIYAELITRLNYANFPNLKNDYSVNWSDAQSCVLTITYDNGKNKTVDDYGLLGTYGLERIYSLLFELRKNQIWKKA